MLLSSIFVFIWDWSNFNGMHRIFIRTCSLLFPLRPGQLTHFVFPQHITPISFMNRNIFSPFRLVIVGDQKKMKAKDCRRKQEFVCRGKRFSALTVKHLSPPVTILMWCLLNFCWKSKTRGQTTFSLTKHFINWAHPLLIFMSEPLCWIKPKMRRRRYWALFAASSWKGSCRT